MSCVLCNRNFEDADNTVVVQQKSADTINSTERGDNIHVESRSTNLKFDFRTDCFMRSFMCSYSRVFILSVRRHLEVFRIKRNSLFAEQSISSKVKFQVR
jgi:hypothetical protein